MAATMPLRPTAPQSSAVRLLVVEERDAPMCLLPPSVLLISEWQLALHSGRSTAAAGYRRLIDAIADEEPTWEDAEWQ